MIIDNRTKKAIGYLIDQYRDGLISINDLLSSMNDIYILLK